MADNHNHNIPDADSRFEIDINNRTIKNTSSKVSLIQYDHNSERFSFVIPKEIDGYDLSRCKENGTLSIEIQYRNIDGTTRKKHPYLYVVDDLHEYETDKTKFEFSWLIPSNATQYAGSLDFSVVITCFEEIEEDGVTRKAIAYRWSTGIFSSIAIGPGLSNGNDMYEAHLDLLYQWKEEVFDDIEDQVNEHLPTVIKLYESEVIL